MSSPPGGPLRDLLPCARAMTSRDVMSRLVDADVDVAARGAARAHRLGAYPKAEVSYGVSTL
jgi:hypothetical protein